MMVGFGRLVSCFVAILCLSSMAMAQDTYTYDDAGRLKSITYDNGATVNYSYDDANNRTQEVVANVPLVITCTYSSTSRLNMRTLVDTNPGSVCDSTYSGTEDVTVEITVTSDIKGSGSASSGTTKHAIMTGTWPSSTYSITLKLILDSGTDIRGGGGRGGKGGDFYSSSGKVGKNAGHGIYMEEDLEIVNSGAITGGGGGGKGGGASIEGYGDDGYYSSFGGGGGGGGYPNGTRGYGGSDIGYSGSAGANGTTSGGGNGGSLDGKKGGGAGASGVGSGGGSPGYAIKKNSNILVISGSGTNGSIGS